MTQDAQSAPRVGSRIIALVLLMAGVELWLSHHLGLTSQTPWVSLSVGAISKAADWLLSKQEREAFGLRVREAVDAWLPAARVRTLWALALTGACLSSSVTVISSDTDTRAKAVLRSVEGDVLRARELRGGVARFPVFTNPLGRPLRLSVDGYLEEPIAVYPIVGLRVTPDRDLRLSPSVLFRPPPVGVQTLASAGTFLVAWKGRGAPQVVVPAQQGHQGSFLVGRARAIPAANVSLWRLELEGVGVGQAMLSQMVYAWSRPRIVDPATPLAPGMTLVAEIRTRVDKVVARAEVTLGSEALIDVGLLPVDAGG